MVSFLVRANWRNPWVEFNKVWSLQKQYRDASKVFMDSPMGSHGLLLISFLGNVAEEKVRVSLGAAPHHTLVSHRAEKHLCWEPN